MGRLRLAIIAIFLLAAVCVAQEPTAVAPSEPAQGSAVTRAQLEKRIAYLQDAYHQTVANAQALNGAIQECQHWLEELDKAEKEKAAAKEPKSSTEPQATAPKSKPAAKRR
jgi:hypothetical protein